MEYLSAETLFKCLRTTEMTQLNECITHKSIIVD